MILEEVAYVSNGKREKFMTSLDLKNGFWQVSIRSEDREKTAFVTYDRLFIFR